MRRRKTDKKVTKEQVQQRLAEFLGRMPDDPLADTALYPRWSTDDQGDGTTLDTQLEACMEVCQKQGFRYSKDTIFLDDGHSGGDLNRPALTRLRAAVEDGRIRRVVVYRLDRLTRSSGDFHKLVEDEWENGKLCEVWSSQEGFIDLDNPAVMLLTTISVGFAEHERLVIKLRTSGGKIRRAKEGLNPGITPPFGYDCGDVGVFIIDPDESPIVRRIFGDYLSGVGYSTIAMNLNDEGVAPRNGGLWRSCSVKKVLTNEAYYGRMIYGEYKHTPKSKRKPGAPSKVKRDEPIADVEDVYPVLIPKDEWERAQAVRSRRKEAKAPRELNGTYLLSGIARCGECGEPMTGWKWDKEGKKVYYVCLSYRMHRKEFRHCNQGLIRAEMLEGAVLELLRQQLNQEAIAGALSEATNKQAARLARWKKAVEDVRGQLAQNVQNQEKARTAFYSGNEAVAAFFMGEMARLADEHTTIQSRLAVVEAKVNAQASAKIDSKGVQALIDRFDNWEALTREQQKSVLREVVESLSVYREKAGEGYNRTGRGGNKNPLQIGMVSRLSGMMAGNELAGD